MTGTAIIVNGEIVAWFADHDELSAEWCSVAYGGEWLAWPADAPVLDGVSDEDMARVGEKAEAMKALFEGSEL
ncbi:MAG: hypothetical protein KDK05_03880 [Candidatus Competibacteraceae bacterium]|nr:hypothetical protein [Candidatus Competibacteraceae bacterium]